MTGADQRQVAIVEIASPTPGAPGPEETWRLLPGGVDATRDRDSGRLFGPDHGEDGRREVAVYSRPEAAAEGVFQGLQAAWRDGGHVYTEVALSDDLVDAGAWLAAGTIRHPAAACITGSHQCDLGAEAT
jgi:hypothetical protein